MLFSALVAATVAFLPEAMAQSATPVFKNGRYYVSDTVSFAHRAIYTFDNGFPQGLQISDHDSGPTGSVFQVSNVNVNNGYLELLVPGKQTKKPFKGGQIGTNVQNIKYASVRTTAILTEPAGVCNGMFFYYDDTQESDIEWLSDRHSGANGGVRQIWFTNQDANGDGEATEQGVNPPANATSSEHEYRIDWTPNLVQFFIDGQEAWKTTSDVPSVPGPWLWNNWSNGDHAWSAGPPAKDAVFKIKKIEMYYDTA